AGLGFESADVIVEAGDLGEHRGLARRPPLGFAEERAAAHAVAETLPAAVETAAKIERRRRSARSELDRLALLGAERRECAAKSPALVPIELALDGGDLDLARGCRESRAEEVRPAVAAAGEEIKD